MAALLALLLLLPPTGPAAASPGGDPPGTPEVPPGPPEPPQDLLDAAYQARCAAPPAPGPCRASFQRWFHSPGGGGCRPFTYGGCGGNANNYARHQDCMRSCQRPAPSTEPAVQPTIALALLLLPLLLLLGGIAAALTRRRFSGCAPPGLGRSPPTPDKEALVGALGPM